MAKSRYVVGFADGDEDQCVYGKRQDGMVEYTTPFKSKKAARKALDWLDRADSDVGIFRVELVKKVKKEAGYVQKEG